MRKGIKRHCFLLAALALAVLAAWPLLSANGLLNTRGGGDSPFLLQRLHQLTTAVADGHFPVRWMPDANYGYGYPFYNFYAPLSIYITAVFRLIGFSFTRSIQLSQLAGFIVAAWGIFALSERWFRSRWAAFLSAAAYTTAPFHLVNIYVRGDSLAEFWAMAFYPLLILAVDRLFDARPAQRKSRLALLALAYAALILSHNISALIFSPFLLLYILLRFVPSRRKLADLQAPVLALLLAFALAAWFFVPAMMEKTAVQLAPVTQGYFHFSRHFRAADLVQRGLLFEYNPDGGIAFRMGLIQFLSIAAGSAALLRAGRKRKTGQPVIAFILLTFAISTFMILPLSTLLWEHLPLLSFTQFPWRFLSVQAFAGAAAVGALGLLPRPRVVVPLLTGLLFMAAFGGLRVDHLALSDADVTAVHLAQYEWFTGNIGSTVSAEYLPAGLHPRPYTSAWLNRGERDAAVTLHGDAEIRIVNRGAVRQEWAVTAVTPAAIQLPTLNWMGWEARIDGRLAPITPAANGLITLDVPTGTHTVSLRLRRTPIQLAAELFSLFAFLLTGWLLRPSKKWAGRGYVLPVLAVLAAMTAIVRLRPSPPPPPLMAEPLTADFAQMGYFHHDVGGTLFDNGAILTAYTYTPPADGETQVTIRLEWARLPSAQTMVTLALGTPSIARPAFEPAAQPLLSQSRPMAEQMVFRFDTASMPFSLFVPQLQVEGSVSLTPSGQKRGELYLRPLLFFADGLMAEEGGRPLAVRAISAVQNLYGEQGQRGNITVALEWFTERPSAVNYNVSLRLVDANGKDVSQWDGQPGYGFQPSSLWQAGVWMPDQITLPLPSPSSSPPYALVAHLYDVTKADDLLIGRLGVLDGEGGFVVHQPAFELPEGMDTVYEDVIFYEDGQPLIQLRGTDVERSGDGRLIVRLYWEMLAETAVSYTRFVHLSHEGEPPIAQNDGLPMQNSYPTSQWQAGEIVTDEVTLPAHDGYALTTGFYQNLDGRWLRLQTKESDLFIIQE